MAKIHLTESEFKQVISNTVKTVLSEISNKMKKVRIGSLLLISYSNGLDWEVYDEDGEYQGMFCGDIKTATEEEIWSGL